MKTAFWLEFAHKNESVKMKERSIYFDSVAQ